MRFTCAVPYFATSESRPSTMAGRALSASMRTASLSVTSLAMGRSAVGAWNPDGSPIDVTGPGSAFGEGAIAAQALVTLFQQLVDTELLEFVQLVEQDGFETNRHGLRIAMRTAQRLTHDLVDQAVLEQARRRETHDVGGILGLVGALPEDGSAAFRRDDRVGRVLQHERAVAHADSQRAAGTTFTGNGADDRHAQFGHF